VTKSKKSHKTFNGNRSALSRARSDPIQFDEGSPRRKKIKKRREFLTLDLGQQSQCSL